MKININVLIKQYEYKIYLSPFLWMNSSVIYYQLYKIDEALGIDLTIG